MLLCERMKMSEKEDVVILTLAALGLIILVGSIVWIVREIKGAATPVSEPTAINRYAP